MINKNRSTRFAVALASFLLFGCGGDKPEEMLASAKTFLAKNDQKSALIQIKNALQANPDSAEGRYLLGVMLLKGGNAPAAETEFRKALALKYPKELVIPRLAESLLAQRQKKKLVDEFGGVTLATAEPMADLQTSLAGAYQALGDIPSTDAALKAALAASPQYVPAVILQARMIGNKGAFDPALALVDSVLKQSPSNAEALKLQGDILQYGKKDLDQAVLAYKKATAASPGYVPAHISLIGVYLSRSDFEAAKAQLNALQKAAPRDPQTLYATAQYAYQKKDNKAATEAAQQLLKIGPDNVAILQLVGAIELQTGSLVQAEAHLARAVQMVPKLYTARQLLVTTYLRTGRAAKALETLQPARSDGELPPSMFSQAGEVYLQNGDTKLAEQYFEKASKLDPSNPGKRTTLALTRLIGGDTNSFGELENIASSDTGVSADMALINAHLQRHEYDKALVAIDGFEKKRPNEPLPYQLRGRALLMMHDSAGARKSFEHAVEISPVYFPAVASLAGLDVAAQKPEDAKKRFEAVLAKDPGNTQALLAMSQLAVSTGASPEEVTAPLKKAIASDPLSAAPRRRLIDWYLRTKDLKQASSVAQDAAAALPDSPDILDALGRVQEATGDLNQAIGTYGKLAATAPSSPIPNMRIADLQMKMKNPGGAEQSLRKVLEAHPNQVDAQLGLVMIYAGSQRYKEAVAVAKTVQRQRPKDPAGFMMEGDVALTQKDIDAAVAVYRAGLAATNSPVLAVKLHSVLGASGKTAEADRFASDWTRAHSGDPLFMFHLGETSLGHDNVAAEKYFAAVVQLAPDNSAAQNNLAWAAYQNGKDSALEYARRANAMAPNTPAYMDTMATILAGKKDFAAAIDLQKKVVNLRPDDPSYRFSLAKIYVRAGDKPNAKSELDALAKLGDKFTAQAEVTTLLRQL